MGNEASGLTINEIIAFASVLISIGTNVVLYIHLSATMNGRFDSFERKIDSRFEKVDARFDSVERHLEMIQGDTHAMDVRLTKLER
jgi:hypothetical protein